MFSTEKIFDDFKVHTVVLDRFGFIVAANDQWKAAVDGGGLLLPGPERTLADHGLGENYLRLCAFADPISPRLVTGISQLLAGRTDCFSLVYPGAVAHGASLSGAGAQRRWFLLLAFPDAGDDERVVVQHVDVTAVQAALMLARGRRTGAALAADAIATAPAEIAPTRVAVDPPRSVFVDVLAEEDVGGHAAGTVERSFAQAFGVGRAGWSASPGRAGVLAAHETERHQPTLSRRQWEVLGLMTAGLTNVEIAKRLGLSPNTVKIHVSGILSRLGLPSRTQAVHWALTRGQVERRS